MVGYMRAYRLVCKRKQTQEQFGDDLRPCSAEHHSGHILEYSTVTLEA